MLVAKAKLSWLGGGLKREDEEEAEQVFVNMERLWHTKQKCTEKIEEERL